MGQPLRGGGMEDGIDLADLDTETLRWRDNIRPSEGQREDDPKFSTQPDRVGTGEDGKLQVKGHLSGIITEGRRSVADMRAGRTVHLLNRTDWKERHTPSKNHSEG